MNIYILDYCNVYSADIYTHTEYVHILTFGQFDNTFRGPPIPHIGRQVSRSATLKTTRQ